MRGFTKRLLLVFGLLLAPDLAFACDTYASVDIGSRTVTYNGDWDAGFVLVDQSKSRHFTFADAGTGTKMIVGVPDDGGDGAAQIKTPPGSFWFGPEKFVGNCN